MSQLHDDAVALRDLLSKPERWTKFRDARDEDGWAVSGRSPAAVCWCLGGASWMVTDDDSDERYVALSDSIRAVFPHRESLCDFNDHHVHDDIVKVLDRVVERTA